MNTYPVEYRPEKEGRTGVRGFGGDPVVWLQPNRQMKLTETEFSVVSSSPRYQSLKEKSVIVEYDPIIESEPEPVEKTEGVVNKENLFDNLLGFSVAEAKKQLSEQGNVETLKKWLEAEEAEAKPRSSIVSLLSSKINTEDK